MEKSSKNPILIRGRFMGEFSISLNERPIDSLSTAKTRALIAYLLIERESEHLRGRLAGFFWPDVPESAALHNLRQALSQIRKSFAEAGWQDDPFSGNRESVRLNPVFEVSVDSQEIESQLSSLLRNGYSLKERGFPVRRLVRLLGLYRGQLLPSLSLDDSCAFDEWLTMKREDLDRLVVEGAAWLLGYHEQRGDWAAARSAAEMLTRICPWDEDFQYHLIHSMLHLKQGNVARSQYRAVERYLKEELDVEPGKKLKQLAADIERFIHDGRYPPVAPRKELALPLYVTPFFGRDQELETLEAWVSDADCRLVSLTGPGGSGKTRLACQLIRDQQTLFKDGVFFIPLTDCDTREKLISTIFHQVSGDAERKPNALTELIEWLKYRRALLVFDGVEEVGEVRTLVADLLANAPHIVFLCTTYQPLGLIGERILSVRGLDYQSEEISKDEPPALKLFLCHLQSESHPQVVEKSFKERAVEICAMVEGLPLAIDLAASQVREMTVGEVLDRLREGLEVLSTTAPNLPARQRSVELCFNLAWNNLGECHQQMLRYLTIFQSPYSIDAALAVCGVSLGDIAAFIDRSLITEMTGGRYRFHSLLQRYITDKAPLLPAEITELEQKYCSWFIMRFEDIYKNRSGRQMVDFLRQTDQTLRDLIHTITILTDRSDWVNLERMIQPLYVFFEARGMHRDGAEVFEYLLNRCSAQGDSLRCRMLFSTRAGTLLLRIQQFSRACDMLQASLEQSRKLGDRGEEIRALLGLSSHAVLQKKATTAIDLARDALRLADEISDEELLAQAYYNLAYAEDVSGDVRNAMDHLQNCRVICELQGDWRRLSKVLTQLGDCHCSLGNTEKAVTFYRDAFYYAAQLENSFSQALITNNLGTAYMELQRYDAAREAFEDSLIACRKIGDREGESIALSNMGEIALELEKYEEAVDCNLRALEIAVEIDSAWAEMSAYSTLAAGYLALGKFDLSQSSTLTLLDLAEESEAMFFFQRALLNGCSLLIERGSHRDAAGILKFILIAEDTDDFLKNKVTALLAKQTPCVDVIPPESAAQAAGQLRMLLESVRNELDRS